MTRREALGGALSAPLTLAEAHGPAKFSTSKQADVIAEIARLKGELKQYWERYAAAEKPLRVQLRKIKQMCSHTNLDGSSAVKDDVFTVGIWNKVDVCEICGTSWSGNE